MREELADFQLGNRLFAQRKYSAARQAFLNHVADFPEDAANIFERVAACYARERSSLAESYYRKALELNPEHFRALSGLAKILPVKSDERLEVLEKAVSIQPDYLLLLDVGEFHRSVRKDYAHARDAYVRAWQLNPGDKSAYQKLWSLCSITGDKEESALWSKRWRERAS